ncbi:hypothetical protein N7481_010540 [Penicillium waksmanii]|uniref:uncharacterized protein n=1 Tax=Penicillium waksmanii TaxID=69791 RepID=UPI002547B1EE|nr:uncharacterized protein N7481_010540 [Penicillium waksmanii]KAJ5973330.1 hypothetical protein N7481_010540 [Penicillium waksmanii]
MIALEDREAPKEMRDSLRESGKWKVEGSFVSAQKGSSMLCAMRGGLIRGILPTSSCLYWSTPAFTRDILADLRKFSVLSHDGLHLELLVSDPSRSTRGVSGYVITQITASGISDHSRCKNQYFSVFLTN